MNSSCPAQICCGHFSSNCAAWNYFGFKSQAHKRRRKRDLKVIPALSIALSGMQVATTELDAAASNIANSQTTGGVPGTSGALTNPVYQPVTVTLSDEAKSGTPGGVKATTSSSLDYTETYDPTAPYADSRGYVATPAVDLSTQLVNVAYARIQFEANAKVAKVASQMAKTAIDILA